MFKNLSIAIGNLFRSRKFVLWLIALASTGATAVLTQDAAAADLFWKTLVGGAALVGTLYTVEDSAEKLNTPKEPAG